VVYLLRFGKRLGQVPLQCANLRLQGADAAVELTIAQEVREVFAQVDFGEPEEVPFAAPSGPLGENREGENLARRKRRWAARLSGRGRMCPLPPVVYQDVERNEK
jgi:hypothetical protein